MKCGPGTHVRIFCFRLSMSEIDLRLTPRAAADAGATFWNSGNFYGMPDPLSNLWVPPIIIIVMYGQTLTRSKKASQAFLRRVSRIRCTREDISFCQRWTSSVWVL